MRWTVAVAMIGLAGCSEEQIALDDLPPPVRSAVLARFADATMSQASRDREGLKRVFEVTLERGGRKIDVTTTPDGELTVVEIEIARADLPAAVGKWLDEHYPGATYQKVEEVRHVKAGAESLAFYEALLVDGSSKWWEVQVSADGTKLLNAEKKKPGEID